MFYVNTEGYTEFIMNGLTGEEQSNHWYDKSTLETWKTLFDTYAIQAQSIAFGTTRLAIITPEWVYKLPLYDHNRSKYNYFELYVFQANPFPCAFCEVVEEVDKIAVLRMERVHIPDWTYSEWIQIHEENLWLIDVGDGSQVGYTRHGDLVAYDYAHLGSDYDGSFSINERYAY